MDSLGNAYSPNSAGSGANTFPRSSKAIYVGGTGNVEVYTGKKQRVKFESVPVGTILPIIATGTTANTTATKLVVMY